MNDRRAIAGPMRDREAAAISEPGPTTLIQPTQRPRGDAPAPPLARYGGAPDADDVSAPLEWSAFARTAAAQTPLANG